MIGEIVEHGGLRVAVVCENNKYIAWIECPERHLLAVGYSFGEKVSMHYYDSPEKALAAAKSAIDTGEVKVHP